MRVVIEVDNDLAPMTALTVARTMPDVQPEFRYTKSVCRQTELYRKIHGLKEYDEVQDELTFFLPSGCMVLADFRPEIPPMEFLQQFSTGVSRRFMYLSETHLEISYSDLGIDLSNNKCERVRFINPKATGDKKLLMPIRMRYGADPIIKHALDGLQLVDCSISALQALIVDVAPEGLDPKVSIEECWGYPFDILHAACLEVKDYIPDDVLRVLEGNAERTNWVAGLRELISWSTAPEYAPQPE